MADSVRPPPSYCGSPSGGTHRDSATRAAADACGCAQWGRGRSATCLCGCGTSAARDAARVAAAPPDSTQFGGAH